VLTPGRRTPHEVAYAAHRVEVSRLGLQSGIQDQLCSAFGGINFIDMHEYPHATVSRVQVPDSVWWELERRLVLVFLGRTHVSSAVHERVIAELSSEGADAPRLEALRTCAALARDAVYAGDFAALGQAMERNTAAQQDLHPDLVSADAAGVIDVAKAHGAQGWKVNGAGGEGGSVTLLAGSTAAEKRALLAAVSEASPLYQVVPTYLSRTGLRIWEG
jgi:D-glycero-alpha-D-manno-heptose-7-phosphate kinase